MGILGGVLRGAGLVTIWMVIKLIASLFSLLKWSITGTSAIATVGSDKGTEETGSGNKTVVKHAFELLVPVDGITVTTTYRCPEQAAEKIVSGNEVRIWYNRRKDQAVLQKDVISDFTGSLIGFAVCAVLLGGLLLATLMIIK